MDELELTVQLALMFLAVFAGIPAGFWLQDWIDRRKLKEERLQLLQFFEQNLKKNLGLISQAKKELQSAGNVIFCPLDLEAWPYIAQQVTLFQDEELSTRLQYVYYELKHLERKIDKQYDLAFAMPIDIQDKRAWLISHSILPHVSEIEESATELIEAIGRKIRELE